MPTTHSPVLSPVGVCLIGERLIARYVFSRTDERVTATAPRAAVPVPVGRALGRGRSDFVAARHFHRVAVMIQEERPGARHDRYERVDDELAGVAE